MDLRILTCPPNLRLSRLRRASCDPLNLRRYRRFLSLGTFRRRQPLDLFVLRRNRRRRGTTRREQMLEFVTSFFSPLCLWLCDLLLTPGVRGESEIGFKRFGLFLGDKAAGRCI